MSNKLSDRPDTQEKQNHDAYQVFECIGMTYMTHLEIMYILLRIL